jgi:formylglycine-generating enzyme required for sulfatase activity
MLVVGIWVCPEMAWGQSKKPTAGSVPGPPSGSKPQAPQVSPKQPSRKSATGTPSQPIEGSDFAGSALGLVSNPKGPFKWIPPGTFQMGSPVDEQYRENDETQHTVTLNRGFWLLDHEVTQEEHKALTGYTRSYFYSRTGLRPVDRITWDDAVAFCKELTKKDREAGRIAPNQEYRLPTEAEWEYACRAGTKTDRYYDHSDGYYELDSIAWWAWNSDKETRIVKQKLPNDFGLYDMLGNVSEWCSDWYDAYPSGNVSDPKGPISGTLRVKRGGDCYSVPGEVRSAKRESYDPGSKPPTGFGFRPALSSVRSAQ